MYRLVKTRCLIIALAGILSGRLSVFDASLSDSENYLFPETASKDSFYQKNIQWDEALFTKGGFALQFVPPKCALPRLDGEIVFQGINRRPDARGRGVLLTLLSSGSSCFIHPGKRYFIDRKRNEIASIEKGPSCLSYYFNESLEQGKLWLELIGLAEDGSSASVRIGGDVKRESGESVTETERITVRLRQAETAEGRDWFLGKNKVDAAFPVKQKMRRVGKDLFLLMHGGDDYISIAAKERFDFSTEEGENYCRFLKVDEYLAWDGKYWVDASSFLGEVSDVPILLLKKMDDKTSIFELWDVGGARMQVLQLVRYPQTPLECEELVKELEYVGLKTWNGPTVATATGGRFSLKPNDWLVRSKEGWRKIQTVQDLKDYVSGKITEPLFIFDGMERVGTDYLLKGHLFNSLRSEVLTVLLAPKNCSAKEENEVISQPEKTPTARPVCNPRKIQ